MSAGLMNETRLGRPMLSQGLKDAWAGAEAQIEGGEFEAAFVTLRDAWNEHGDAADTPTHGNW